MEGGNLGQKNQAIKCKINTAVGSRKAHPGPNIPRESITHTDLRCHNNMHWQTTSYFKVPHYAKLNKSKLKR